MVEYMTTKLANNLLASLLLGFIIGIHLYLYIKDRNETLTPIEKQGRKYFLAPFSFLGVFLVILLLLN